MTPRDPIYAGHRYPAEIISYAVWLYFRFPLSLRMVEEMLAARGISVTHETIRQWGLKFGRDSPTGSVGERLAVATNGTSMRSSSASPGKALALACRRPGWLRSRCSGPEPARQGGRQTPVPQAPQEAGLSPSCARHRQAEELRRGKREIMPGVEHRQHKGLNNRGENSHQPTRRRARIMKRFKSPRHVQRFLSGHDQVANLFPRRREDETAANFRSGRTQAFATWADVTGVAMAA